MTINLITRREWGARAPDGSYTRLDSARGVKVHYTGGRVTPAIVYDHDLCVAMVQSIQGYHMDANGWLDIAYSMIACPHRKVFQGRGLHRLSAANGAGQNSGHYAVLGLVGNAGLVQPPDGLLHGILDAVDYLRAKGGAGREIRGHRDGYRTDCPGGPLYAWIQRGAPRPGGESADPDAWPGRLLRYPPTLRGQDVERWQQRATDRGFALTVDGIYGRASRAVCREIQRAAGLEEDGIVGADTWAATVRTR